MKALRLSEIAALVGGELVGTADPEITGAAGLEDAGPGDLTFLAKRSSWRKLAAAAGPRLSSSARAWTPTCRPSGWRIPTRAFAAFLERLAPDLDRVFPPGIHPTAVIDPTAEVARASPSDPTA